jgi:hypothetical protein
MPAWGWVSVAIAVIAIAAAIWFAYDRKRSRDLHSSELLAPEERSEVG